jgi:hypothetical protein
MTNLSAPELIKRPWRAGVIIKKITERSSFDLAKGGKAILIADKDLLSKLQAATDSRNSTFINSFLLIDSKAGKTYKITDLVKTSEFGGKGDRGGTIKEDRELESLNQQIDEAKKRLGSSTIPVKVGNKIYNVFRAESTPGTPKSDFHLIDNDGKEIVWISHKDGRGPKDFQQWGGISQNKEPTIFLHPETQKFITELKSVYPTGLPPATSLYQKIKDKKLKMLSVYGNKYGSSQGQQNVSILLQGPIQLVKSGSNYVLSANHVHYNGDSVDADGFEPVLMAIFKGDRSDAGIKGTRIVISPIAGRKASEFNYNK